MSSDVTRWSLRILVAMRLSARWFWRLALPMLGQLLWVGQPVTARADDAIVLKVRGKSQLRLRELSRRPDGKNTFRVTLTIQLSDGQPPSDGDAGDDRAFADRLIHVELRGNGDTLFLGDRRTSDDGTATFERAGVSPAAYTVVASYRGDELRDPARGVFAIDMGRQQSQVRLWAPPRIALSDELPLRIQLSSEGEPIDGPVVLRIGPRREQLTVSQGYLEQRYRGQGLGKAGDRVTLIAQFAGSRIYSPSETKQELLLLGQSMVTLQLLSTSGAGEIPQGNKLTAAGVVRDEAGPLTSELVELEALSDEGLTVADSSQRKRSLGHAETDAQGRFEIVVPKLMLPPGPTLIVAQVFPRRGHILPGRSPEVAVQVLPPEPISLLYFLLPLIGTVLLGLGIVLGRKLIRLATALVQELRARQNPSTLLPLDVVATPVLTEVRQGEPGVQLTSMSRLSSLRRAVDFHIDGQVLDATFGSPVSAQILVFADGNTEEPLHTVTTSATGGFVSPALHSGRYQVRIGAPGYLSQQFLATIPHRGELRQVTVRIEPLRTRLLQEWRRVAEGIVGESVMTQTPRELYDRLSAGKPHPIAADGQKKLEALTTLCEHAYYSPRVCTPEMLLHAAQLAEEILRHEPTVTAKATELRAPGAPRPLVQQPRAL